MRELKYCPHCRSKLKQRPLEGMNRIVCNRCGFIEWKNPSPVAAAIVLLRDEVVLVRTSYHLSEGTWGLPGGYVERGETAEQAVVREIKEETNTDLELIGFVGTYSLRKKDINLLYVVFWGRTRGEKLRPGGDVHSVDLFAPEEALNTVGETSLSGQAILDWMRLTQGVRRDVQ